MRKYALIAVCLGLATGSFACGPKAEPTPPVAAPVTPVTPATTTSATPPSAANTPPAVVDNEPPQPPAPTKPGQTVKLPSGLEYTDERIGTGPIPVKGQKISVHYIGRLKDKTIFDTSLNRGQPFEFIVGGGQTIKGWDEGVRTMHVGGVRKLVIPPALGYGAREAGKIPPNSTLYFEIQLMDIK